MSDRRETRGVAILGLEEVFLSREFGRRPARRVSSTAWTVEPDEPVQLEQVFLSESFGQPEAFASALSTPEPASAASGRPTLIVLKGGGEGSAERDGTRYRAIAAVSGVAAAALVVAGLPSGTTARPGQPRFSAQGPSENQNATGSAAGSRPGRSGIGTPAASAGSGGGASFAQLTFFTGRPKSTGAGAVQAPTAVPSTPAAIGGGGTSMLAPALAALADAVSTTGSTVSTTSGEVGQVIGPPGTTTSSTMHSVGETSPTTVFASASRQ